MEQGHGGHGSVVLPPGQATAQQQAMLQGQMTQPGQPGLMIPPGQDLVSALTQSFGLTMDRFQNQQQQAQQQFQMNIQNQLNEMQRNQGQGQGQ